MNVYDVPFVSVAKVQLSVDSDVGEQVCPPGAMVTVYAVIGVPFVAAGDQLTVMLPLPGTAVGRAGAEGYGANVTFEPADTVPVPPMLHGLTLKV